MAFNLEDSTKEIMQWFNPVAQVQKLIGYAYPLERIMMFMKQSAAKLKPEELVKMGKMFSDRADKDLALIKEQRELRIPYSKTLELEELELQQLVLLKKPDIEAYDKLNEQIATGQGLTKQEQARFDQLKERLGQNRDIFDQAKMDKLKALREDPSIPAEQKQRITKNVEALKKETSVQQQKWLEVIQSKKAELEKDNGKLDLLEKNANETKEYMDKYFGDLSKAKDFKKQAEKGELKLPWDKENAVSAERDKELEELVKKELKIDLEVQTTPGQGEPQKTPTPGEGPETEVRTVHSPGQSIGKDYDDTINPNHPIVTKSDDILKDETQYTSETKEEIKANDTSVKGNQQKVLSGEQLAALAVEELSKLELELVQELEELNVSPIKRESIMKDFKELQILEGNGEYNKTGKNAVEYYEEMYKKTLGTEMPVSLRGQQNVTKYITEKREAFVKTLTKVGVPEANIGKYVGELSKIITGGQITK